MYYSFYNLLTRQQVWKLWYGSMNCSKCWQCDREIFRDNFCVGYMVSPCTIYKFGYVHSPIGNQFPVCDDCVARPNEPCQLRKWVAEVKNDPEKKFKLQLFLYVWSKRFSNLPIREYIQCYFVKPFASNKPADVPIDSLIDDDTCEYCVGIVNEISDDQRYTMDFMYEMTALGDRPVYPEYDDDDDE